MHLPIRTMHRFVSARLLSKPMRVSDLHVARLPWIAREDVSAAEECRRQAIHYKPSSSRSDTSMDELRRLGPDRTSFFGRSRCRRMPSK